MLLLNFSHPLTHEHLAQIAEFLSVGQTGTGEEPQVIEVYISG